MRSEKKGLYQFFDPSSHPRCDGGVVPYPVNSDLTLRDVRSNPRDESPTLLVTPLLPSVRMLSIALSVLVFFLT
jgi:hypothetical protein